MGAGRGRWPCSSLLYPLVKSFLTCLPERLQGLGPPYLAPEAWWGMVLGEVVLEEVCRVIFVPGEVTAIDVDMGLQEVWGCQILDQDP